MGKMHSLLGRQLKKFFGSIENVPDELAAFVASIDDTYREFDTDREMLERSLELSSQEMLQINAEMRALFQALPDLLFTLDDAGTILSAKVGRADDLFISSERIMGKKIYDIPQKQVSELFREAFSKVMETNSIVSLEYSLEIEGGEDIYEARFVPFLENRSIVIIRNITERKRSERALLESERRLQYQNKELVQTKNFLQNILDSSVDVIVTTDLHGTILYSSPAISKVTGHEQDELRGKKPIVSTATAKKTPKK